MRAPVERKRIVLPEGETHRILRATTVLKARGVAEIALLGNADTMRRRVADDGLALNGIEVIGPATSQLLDGFVDTYMAPRRHKGVPLPVTRDRMSDPTNFRHDDGAYGRSGRGSGRSAQHDGTSHPAQLRLRENPVRRCAGFIVVPDVPLRPGAGP